MMGIIAAVMVALACLAWLVFESMKRQDEFCELCYEDMKSLDLLDYDGSCLGKEFKAQESGDECSYCMYNKECRK